MTAIKTIFGYVHCGMALIVAIQFLVSPMYGGDLNGTVWDAVSILMAIGCGGGVGVCRNADAGSRRCRPIGARR